jgi:hypothetical protein
MTMEKSNLFFTYLSKLIPQNENSVSSENTNEKLTFKANETPSIDNEWLQEYDLIYRSYAIESY